MCDIYHSRFISEGTAEASLTLLRDTPFYQNDLALRNKYSMKGGKPFAVWSQYISDMSAVGPLVFTTSMEREVVFFYFVPDTTRDYNMSVIKHFVKRVNP
jgi:hypothetical protein